MFEQRKRALTPEELIAWKGDASFDRARSLWDDGAEAEPEHVSWHASASTNGAHPAFSAPHDAADDTPRT